MEEQRKVYIRSCNGRGSEVINTLKELGATKIIELSGEAKDTIYFINHDNHITSALIDSEIGAIIMDNYKEIELPTRKWKVGDILAFNHRSSVYAVFKKYAENETFDSYIFICGEEMHVGMTFQTAVFHLANEKEKENFSRMCNYMMSRLKAADAVLNKDAE